MLSKCIPKRFVFQFLEKENLKGILDLDSKTKLKAPTSIDGVSLPNHYPVNHDTVTKLIKENLFTKDSGNKLMLDCTIGTAGHAKLLLKKFCELNM